MTLKPLFSSLGAAALALTTAGAALAQDAQNTLGDLEIVGAPHQGGIGFQEAATNLANDLHSLDHMILWIIGVITVFVTGLILVVILRFNARSNPKPAGFTHNSPLEVTWTIVPIVILVFIGAFSLPVLFEQQEIPEADLTIKVTGYQWYWGYEYPDVVDADGNALSFESFMIGQGSNIVDADIHQELADAGYSDAEFRLATDTAVVVPVGATVVMQVTGADVIHSWAMPAFGVKQDAVPGRLAELWFNADREGIYFGQCSELCGKDHAYMPITVKVVSQEEFDAWVARVQTDGDYVAW
jgi:cytochrome c oxidase subunit 2